MILTSAEIDKRSGVWIALSELFIDNQLTSSDKKRLAEKLRKSGYLLTEIEKILEEEVLPTFSSNLVATTGNWNGWSDEEVQRKVIERLAVGVNSSMNWWRKLYVKFMISQSWKEIKHHFQNIRAN